MKTTLILTEQEQEHFKSMTLSDCRVLITLKFCFKEPNSDYYSIFAEVSKQNFDTN